MVGAKSDVEYESKSPMDEVEDTHTAPAQALMASTSVPDSKDKHETLSIGVPITDTMETPTLITDPPHHIRHGHSLMDDSGIELSAAELTDTEGTNREQRLTDTLPNIPYDPYIHKCTQASPVNALQPDFIAAGQSHSPVSQFPSLQAEEEDIYELQDETHHDVDSAYDANSIRDDDTETLASFITNYRWENGRRYHAYSDGAYWVWIQSKGIITVLIIRERRARMMKTQTTGKIWLIIYTS
jgi:hypothetical protein